MATWTKHEVLLRNDATDKAGDLDFAMAAAFVANMWSVGETRLFQSTGGNGAMRLGVQLLASTSKMRHFEIWTKGSGAPLVDWALEASTHWPTVLWNIESYGEFGDDEELEFRNGDFL